MTMKYKRKEKIIAQDKLSEYKKHQNEHEQFLLAFERPTQIYRYLQSRQMSSPVFLQRNLNYMQNRKRARKRKRTDFAFIDLQNDPLKSLQRGILAESSTLHLEFQGLSGVESAKNATLELSLVRTLQKRKKGLQTATQERKLCETEIACGLNERVKPVQLDLNSHQLSMYNVPNSRPYSLLFRVSCSVDAPIAAVAAPQKNSTIPNGLTNGHCDTGSNSEDDSDEQPAKKRRKTRRITKPNEQASNLTAEEQHVYDSEILVRDEAGEHVLSNGYYEILLYDASIEKSDAPQEWSLVEKESKTFMAFASNPVLKANVRWSHVDIKPPVSKENVKQEILSTDSSSPDAKPLLSSTTPAAEPTSQPITDAQPRSPSNKPRPQQQPQQPVQQQPQRVFYNFLYAKKTRQQTEARTDMHCPWCMLNCCTLYSLLKHLRNCHARFNFTYQEHAKGARIDVSINENYDGSYVGNPLDLQAHIGYCFGSEGPVRRTPVTQLLVYKPKKPSFELSEFMEPETEIHLPRHHMYGHNRLYNHTVTLAPLRPSEMDIDSEDEVDPDWLRQKTVNLIDEFTDVNEGEKEIMKMWNIHIMNHNFIGDCQVPRACTMFIQEYGPEIVQRNLCRNLMVHLANLCDFGLIRLECLRRTAVQLQRLRAKMFADGLLARSHPVHVNRKWDKLRNYGAVPIVTTDKPEATKLIAETGASCSSSINTTVTSSSTTVTSPAVSKA